MLSFFSRLVHWRFPSRVYDAPSTTDDAPSTPSTIEDFTTDDETLTKPRLERQLGDTEISYFLPSRENGVNDMYLHLGLQAPPHVMERSRVTLVWAILRARHPLLASTVEMNDYNDIRFVYSPFSKQDALQNAHENLDYRKSTKDVLLNEYLNGPRTLGPEKLSYLTISSHPDTRYPLQSYDFLLQATHFIGDGMALHNFANDFFVLLGDSKLTDDDLNDLLNSELEARWGAETPQGLPPALETGLYPTEQTNLHRLASRVEFQSNQARLIGGHSFNRRPGNHAVNTVVPTISVDKERTKRMLKSCKSHGVSISSVMFALCNLAWARTSKEKTELPIMFYSAMNLRQYLSPAPMKPLHDSYFHLAIGYFNVILPHFFPSDDVAKTFWHRARAAKEQSANAAKNPLIVPRSRVMATERATRAKQWAKEDDLKANGLWKAPPKLPLSHSEQAKPPSVCLIGLSLLGNLDSIYKHNSFPIVKLESLTTGSRQRAGGMLLFAYTFVGQLWVSLGYDCNGFDDEVEKFWGELLKCMDEFLLVEH
ncbi:hypothetical protein C8J56DRAFT_320793 [Mycena floridula]|nr:hypothetical protein C8J56DRAFT_320793 [Mycena floridula]